MAKLNNINTTDIVEAIRLGCHCMQSVFNADDGDIPYFRVAVRPEVFLGRSLEDHIPGRHLNGLLNAEDAAGVAIEEDAVERHARAAFFSFSGSIALPKQRVDYQGPPVKFNDHNVREGFHALYPLVAYRNSSHARELAKASIEAVLEFFVREGSWNKERMQTEHGIQVDCERTVIEGVARCIGPLVKYYRAEAYGPALDLAVALKEKVISEVFLDDGSYCIERFGGHVHSTTCVMSSLAQLAELTQDGELFGRVKAFYDHGLWELRDQLGWSIEEARQNNDRADEGEMNNTGDVLETALILGRHGYTDCYQDAERILRCHMLPAQLRDVSWIEEPENPDGVDHLRDVTNRIRGSYGFPAPYGHQPIENKFLRFNTDVVGGSVGSLCEALRAVARFDDSGHHVSLLFDHEDDNVAVKSPYPHGQLEVQVKKPAPLHVRIPTWVNRKQLRIDGIESEVRWSNGYLFIAEPPVNRPVVINYELATEEIVLNHRTRDIRVRLRGDEVAAMDNFGADVTFFDEF